MNPLKVIEKLNRVFGKRYDVEISPRKPGGKKALTTRVLEAAEASPKTTRKVKKVVKTSKKIAKASAIGGAGYGTYRFGKGSGRKDTMKEASKKELVKELLKRTSKKRKKPKSVNKKTLKDYTNTK